MTTLRLPTGEAGWPNLIVEGTEGAGKTFASLSLSADPRVGASYVVEVGERRADEYAALGVFRIVEHDGTVAGAVEAIRFVLTLPPEGGRPNVLVIDSGTALWDGVKHEAERIAKSSQAAKETLQRDPDAEIPVGHQAWNKAEDRWWWSWVNDLRGWPGIALLTARAAEVSKFENGKPVKNQTEYRVDLQRGTPFAFDATVRMRLGKPPLVTTAKSLKFSVGASGLELDIDRPLGSLVFDLFGAGTMIELTVAQAKTALVSMARSLGHDDESAREAASHAWSEHGRRSSFGPEAMALLIGALPPVEDKPDDPLLPVEEEK